MSYCDTCGHQFSDVCGTCESLDGVPVQYSPKPSDVRPIKDDGIIWTFNYATGNFTPTRKITNADRIRDVICDVISKSLSPEIIAHTIVEQMLSICPDGKIYRETECDVLSCYDCWLEWLKEEI